jgi:LmbE family N-acetylglucosaminyl deacetylase
MKFLLLLSSMSVLFAQTRVIAFGAHPDDCDIRAAGTAALFKASGAVVKFVSVTNGDAGHQSMHGAELAARRLGEAKESARRLGIEYEVLDNHDGELLPTLEVRRQIIRQIRLWNADIVLAPRPNDYHPDHRYTGVLVQDAAYMVVVPHLMPEVPALRKNPVFLYYEDNFQRPNPFRPDIVVDLDPVIDKKIDALDSHVSQFYEWAALGGRQTVGGPGRCSGAQSLAEAEADAAAKPASPRIAGEMVRPGKRERSQILRGLRDLRIRRPARRIAYPPIIPDASLNRLLLSL